MEISKEQLRQGFISTFGERENIHFYFCPGRVCLIGEHLDYNGGHVLPAAISLGIYAVVNKNEGNIIRCKSASFDTDVFITLADEIERVEADPWGNYVRGVVKYLKDTGLKVPGLDIYFHSNLPFGAGLSSSAAIEVLMAYLVQKEAGVEADLEKTALMCKDVENDFVGMKCGIMDQLAVAMAKPNQALLLDCETVDISYVPINTGDYQFVIINSNKSRALTETAFNERKAECDRALEELSHKFGLRSLSKATIEQANSVSDEKARKRALHVTTENKRVLDAKSVLESGDLVRFGELMKISHQSLKELYEVTGPELDTIAETAATLSGCLGARMTGAGFGGCCIALVKNDKITDFKAELNRVYDRKFSRTLDFYGFQVSGGILSY